MSYLTLLANFSGAALTSLSPDNTQAQCYSRFSNLLQHCALGFRGEE